VDSRKPASTPMRRRQSSAASKRPRKKTAGFSRLRCRVYGPCRLARGVPCRNGKKRSLRHPAAVSAAAGTTARGWGGRESVGCGFGVAHDLVRSLARGEIEPEAESDLHHLTADVAAHQAERFIEQSVERGRRCVLLIHGRGLHSGPSGPALRSALVEFLCQRPLAKHVLASPRPRPSRRHRCASRASATSLISVV